MTKSIVQLDVVDCINLLPCIVIVLDRMKLDPDSRKGLENLRIRMLEALLADVDERAAKQAAPFTEEEIERLGRATVEAAVKQGRAN